MKELMAAGLSLNRKCIKDFNTSICYCCGSVLRCTPSCQSDSLSWLRSFYLNPNHIFSINVADRRHDFSRKSRMPLLIFSWRRMGCFSSCSLFHFGAKSGYVRNWEFCGNSCKNDMAERGCDWNTILINIFSLLLNEVDSDPLLLIKTLFIMSSACSFLIFKQAIQFQLQVHD